MDRNTVLAFALSMIVFVTYVMYQEERRVDFALDAEEQVQAEEAGAASTQESEGIAEGSTTASPAAASDATAPADGDPSSGPAVATPSPVEPAAARRPIALSSIEIGNGAIEARIGNGPAMIESWRLTEFMERVGREERPIDLLDEGFPVLATEVAGISGTSFAQRRFEWLTPACARADSETRCAPGSVREIVQQAVDSSGVLTRTLRLDESGYGFELTLAFENRRGDPVDARFEVVLPARVSEREEFRQVSLVAWAEDSGVSREFVQGIGQPGFLSSLGFGNTFDGYTAVDGRQRWAGFDVQYFAGLVVDPAERARLDVRFDLLDAGESAKARITLPAVSVGSNGVARETLRGFLGPKTSDALATAGPKAGLAHSVDRGWSWLEPLTRFFEIALEKLYVVIPNYGLAIIVLTILVRIVTAPLMVRQMRSSERMRAVQPKLKALQERFKDDRQKQSEEMMKLYREEGINPLGGCLPLLLQFPVLIGLFYALRTSIALRHAPFMLWIDDLSQPATLFMIPGVDFPFRVLPLIMAGSMYAQQKMMPQTGMDPVQARMMLVMMPGMMLLISYTFPSGLVLYWTVSNLLGIAHQYWVRNHMQPAG